MTNRMLTFLRRAVRNGTRVLVGDPGRAFLPTGMDQLSTMDVPVTHALESATVKRTTVWEITATTGHRV
jgi:predicted nicotinamide N-methyase